MITGELKSKIDRVWDAFWSGGISNPLEVIEQITYLLFIRRLDDIQTLAEKKARITKTEVENPVFLAGQAHLRWGQFKNTSHEVMHKTIADEVFPFLRGLGDGSTYSEHMKSYLREHLDNLALQRLRRNKQLTPEDLTELQQMLVASGGQEVDIAWATEQGGGLGIFVRSLVGLDRAAASEAFENYLDGTRFSAEQVRFVNLIVDELTRNGVMEPARLFESPYTDHAPTGPDFFFPDADVEIIVDTLQHIKRTAVPSDVA